MSPFFLLNHLSMPLCTGAPFCSQHRSEFPAAVDDNQHKNQSEHRVKGILQRFYENAVRRQVCRKISQQLDAIINIPQFGTNPGSDKCHGSYRSSRTVNEVGKLFTRNLKSVCDRTHRVTYNQGIGIIVKKDSYAQKPGNELGALLRARIPGQIVDDPGHPSVAGDDGDHSAYQQTKNNDGQVARVVERSQNIVCQYIKHADHQVVERVDAQASGNKSTYPYADKQGQQYLPKYKCKTNGHQGWQHGPPKADRFQPPTAVCSGRQMYHLQLPLLIFKQIQLTCSPYGRFPYSASLFEIQQAVAAVDTKHG